MGTFVIDVSDDISAHAIKVKQLGAAGVIRYYNPLTQGMDGKKSLSVAEAKRWRDAGIPVGVVVEGWGGVNGRGIDGESGNRDARGVLQWLDSVGLHPSPALVVWFAVDCDASASMINEAEVSYFDAIRTRFNMQASSVRPRIGVYGSGWSCMCMVGTKRADEAWVAGSTGWAHYKDYVASNGWRLLQRIYPGDKWNGFNADTDTVNGTLVDAGLMVPWKAPRPVFKASPVPPARALPGPVAPPRAGFWASIAEAFRDLGSGGTGPG